MDDKFEKKDDLPGNDPIVEEANVSASEAVSAEVSPVPEGDLPEEEKPLDEHIKLMSPGRMVARRFFRSKLSIIGLVMLIFLFVMSWLGPPFFHLCGYQWDETTTDKSGKMEFSQYELVIEEDGQFYSVIQVVATNKGINTLAKPDGSHFLGTDKSGLDVFIRLMYGGRLSLTISLLTVFAISILGIIFGGIAGYFGGAIDNIIMRFCDILMCLPGMPILLIVGSLAEGIGIPTDMRIYFLMGFLTLISWPGTARLVRGQILFLREQEYMVAAEAMGFSTSRKIFKHLVPNVLPQLIVSMTLSLGSMILYEASLSYLGMGVKMPYAAWGSMINIVTEDQNVLQNFFNVWGPPGICIIIAVLGFNFVGDGLRDALDPKMRR